MSVDAAEGVAARTGGGDGARPQPSGCSVVVGRFLSSVVVTLRGSLNAASSADVAAVLDDLINGQGNLALVVDLRGLCEVDPYGVEVLSAAAADIERRGGGLRLGGPVDGIRMPWWPSASRHWSPAHRSLTAMSTIGRQCDVPLETGPTFTAGPGKHRSPQGDADDPL